MVVKLGLAHLPPLLLAALRFSMALMPAVFFVDRAALCRDGWPHLARAIADVKQSNGVIHVIDKVLLPN